MDMDMEVTSSKHNLPANEEDINASFPKIHSPLKNTSVNEEEKPVKKCGIPADVGELTNNFHTNENREIFETSEIRGNPVELINQLKNQFGSTEEFSQFERHFYAQGEEVKMLRENVERVRSAYTKLQEEKRKLELQLVSEKASREQDSKNALTEFEKNNMQLNTQIHSMKCEVETWKRKAEATLKESGWLKQQLKSLESEKAEAIRQVGDFTRQNSGIEQYRISIEAYARRQRETMNDIQKRLLDLEKAKESLSSLMEHNQKQINYMAVHFNNRERTRLLHENHVSQLEQELINAKAELVQNCAELARVKVIEKKMTKLMEKLIIENKDLHCGLNLLVSSIHGDIGEENEQFIQSIQQLHEQVEDSVKKLKIGD